MSGHRDEHLDRCTALVLGGLDDAGRTELEAHMAAGCPECESALRALSSGATVLALSVPQQRAPGALRERVLAAVQAEAGARAAGAVIPSSVPAAEDANVAASTRRERPQVMSWAFAIAAALLAVSGLLLWPRAADQTAQLTALQARSNELEETLQSERRWAALLEAPGTRVTRLLPTPDGDPALSARVLYDPDSRRAIIVASNFALTTDRDYELWVLTASGATSAGVVHAEASGRAVARLEHVGDSVADSTGGQARGREAIIAFAVTLEPAGGSPDHYRPSGPVVMVGKLGG
jgi:hypothetical protein